jgi:hypothetical protein
MTKRMRARSVLFLPFNGLASLYVVSTLFGLFQGGIVPACAVYQAAFLNGIAWNVLNIGIAVGLLRRPGRPLVTA